MLTIAWDDRFLVGLPSIDNQHKIFFQLINQLSADFVSHEPREHLSILFDNLNDYADYHFSLEERWMVCQKFPLLKAHRFEHASFSERITELRHHFRDLDRNVTLETMVFLYGWLVQHIQGSDFEFGQFIKRKKSRKTIGYSGCYTIIGHEQLSPQIELHSYSSDFQEKGC